MTGKTTGELTQTETIGELMEFEPSHTWVPGPLLPSGMLVLVCACGSLWYVDPDDQQYHGHRDFYKPEVPV